MMKALLFGITLFLLLVGGPFPLPAQTDTNAPANPAQPRGERENRMLSFLTPAQQIQYAKARAKALEENPELKAEGEEMVKRGAALMANGTMADKQAFMEKMNTHRQKLRQAMLKEDSTLEPIFVRIDEHISEMKAKRLGQAESSAGSTNAPPTSPPTAN